MRRRAAAAATAPGADPVAPVAGSDDGEEGDAPARGRDARRAARAAEREAADARTAKREARDEARLARDAEREAREAEAEAAAARDAAEKQRREDEEAAKWMAQIETAEDGTADDDLAAESGDLVSEFVDYITSRKTVHLEDLASSFGLRVTDAIDRVRGLEAMGRITGVMDDRGKFIYVSLDEMKAMADYITSRGRVPIVELASKSADLLDLEAKAGAAVGPGAAAAAGLSLDELAGEEE